MTKIFQFLCNKQTIILIEVLNNSSKHESIFVLKNHGSEWLLFDSLIYSLSEVRLECMYSHLFQVFLCSACNIGVLRVPLNSSGLRAWISFEVPAVHLHKADFASALLEVSNALKCSNPSPTFRQPFLTHSRVTVPVDCTGRKGHTHIHTCVRV